MDFEQVAENLKDVYRMHDLNFKISLLMYGDLII